MKSKLALIKTTVLLALKQWISGLDYAEAEFLNGINLRPDLLTKTFGQIIHVGNINIRIMSRSKLSQIPVNQQAGVALFFS